MDSEALQLARYYLSRGLHPIPLAPRTKKPPIARGGWDRYKATPPTDAELVSWFASGENNIAIVLGRGKIAVDFDGPGAEAALAAAGVELPEDAPRSRTSNGAHVLLAVQGPVENRVGLLKSPELNQETGKPIWQVDIRGDGGYVVVAPSIHPSGAAYEWLQRPDTLPDAPGTLLTLIASRGAPAAGAGEAAGAPERWVSEAMKGVAHGGRDHTCTKLAGYYLSKALPADVVKSMLYAFAERCTPPLERAEVDKCVVSVAKREARRAALESEGGEAEAGVVDVEPFQVLGYNQGSYFYLPRGSRQVVELRAKHHTKLELLSLAPMAHWERAYPGPSGPRWELAANALIRKAERAGVYDVARVRGRGAWWEPTPPRAILHLGDVLIDGDRSTPVMDLQPGTYIYEAAAPMPVRLEAPMGAVDAHRLIEICELATWERPISAKLLAGWITVAPICGALNWRPHIWLTGPAGCGKSWIMDKIVRHVTGHIALAVQSETTEAGLRQVLGNDARPIVFDEIEGENERAQQRIQNVLALARQASSETGATIIKGSPLGVAKSYRIRSCFAFSSIGVGLQQHADATRVTVLSVEKRHDPARFARLEELVATTLTDSYVHAFNARAIRMVPVIRANARVFAAAGAAVIGSQRLGDQIGALLAGTFSLHNDKLITVAEARAWLEKQDWSEQQSVQETSDETACLNKILEHIVRVSLGTRGPGDRSIGELIEVAAGGREDYISKNDAHAHLLRLGVRVEGDAQGDVFIIASSHTGIARILAETPWTRGWARILRRVKGAQASEGSVRFAGVQCRGVELPLELVSGGLTGQRALI